MLDIDKDKKILRDEKIFIAQSGSPSLNREDPRSVDLDCNTFSARLFPDVPREGGVVESFKTVTALTDGPGDKLPVNLLIVGRFDHPNYLPVFAVDVEASSLVKSRIFSLKSRQSDLTSSTGDPNKSLKGT